MNKNFRHGWMVLLLAALACRPVLAISWNEFLLISVLFAALLGPPLYRWLRKVETFFKGKEKDS